MHNLIYFLIELVYGFIMLGGSKWFAAANVESNDPSVIIRFVDFMVLGWALLLIILALYRFIENESRMVRCRNVNPYPGGSISSPIPAWTSLAAAHAVCSGTGCPGIKIGRTVRDPAARVREICSSSGLLAPGKLEYALWVADARDAERYVHYQLQGRRIHRKRELFIVTVAEATDAIRAAQKLYARPLQTKGAKRMWQLFSVVVIFMSFGVAAQ